MQGKGSCFCMNRGEHHEKNSIYFEMGPDMCYQRCFRTDNVVGKYFNKTCKDYSTTGKVGGQKLSTSLRKLFKIVSLLAAATNVRAMPTMYFPKPKKRRPSGKGKGKGRGAGFCWENGYLYSQTGMSPRHLGVFSFFTLLSAKKYKKIRAGSLRLSHTGYGNLVGRLGQGVCW